MNFSEGRLTVEEGVELYYRVNGDGAPAILIPNAVWMESMLEPLTQNHRVVFYDLRSRGRSSSVAGERTGAEQDLQDLEAVRRGLDLGTVTVLAHSYVSLVAAEHALRFPEAVERLIIVGVMPVRKLPYFERGFPSTQQMLYPPVPVLEEMRREGIDKTDPGRFARTYVKLMLLSRQLATPELAETFPLEMCDYPNEHPDHWLPIFLDHIFPSFGNWDLREPLADLKTQLLVIQGDRDGSLEATREWIEYAPNSGLLIVKNAGHAPFFEQPDVFFPAVESFLSGAWPPGAIRKS